MGWPRELFDILDIPEEFEDMKPFMTNYKVNLVQASDVDPENFRTDLKLIFRLLSMASDGKEMKRYIRERSEEFSHISYETYDCLRELLHVDKWWKINEDTNSGKGEVNMCKALEEIAEMARQEGVEQGKKAGEKEGFEQGLLLAKQVIRLAKEGHSVEEMAEICGIPAEKIREITED